MQQVARYEGIANYVPWLNHSSFRTRGEIIRASRCTLRENQWIAYRGWIIRATSCTKWITLLTVDNTLSEKIHAKITALCFVPWLIPSCIKMHATREIINRSVQLVARNCECPKGVNSVQCVVPSCIKMHATREIINCSVQLVARNCECPKGVNSVPCVIPSCIEMHATRESWIAYRGWIFRATSCTLRGNRESLTEVESFVQQVARYIRNE